MNLVSNVLFVQSIKPFITQSDEFLKARAMLTLAYTVEEDENSELIDGTGLPLTIYLF